MYVQLVFFSTGTAHYVAPKLFYTDDLCEVIHEKYFRLSKVFFLWVVFLPDRRRTPATHPHNSLMWVLTPRGCFWSRCMSGHLPANPWKAFFTAYERIWISRCRMDWFAGCFEFTCKGTEKEVSSNNDSVLSPSVEMFSLTVFYTVYVGSRRRS